MECFKCGGKKAVINIQHGPLCGKCFIDHFEKKVYGTIRKYGLFTKKDVICVACSGGKDSLVALHLVNRLAKKQRQRIFALAVDEGIGSYRSHTLEDLKFFCKKEGIELHIVSFKKEFGFTLDGIIREAKKKGKDVNPCTVCGIMRRRLMNTHAKRLGADVLVVGHNLDDEAQTILMNMMKGGIELSARLGPKTGIVRHEKFVPRVKPLYFCMEKEDRLYSILKGFRVNFAECPYTRDSFRDYVRHMLNEAESRYRGTKYSIVNNFLKMLPLIKEKFSGSAVMECRICGEPGKNDVCSVCTLLENLGVRNGKKKISERSGK